MQKNQFLKVKNSLVELKKRFYNIERYRIERWRSKKQKRDRRSIF